MSDEKLRRILDNKKLRRRTDFDRIREEGERISREEGYKVLLAEIAARDKEIDKLRLTAAERAAVEQAAEHALHGASATLRGLLERTK